jgi:hypothetical protein
MFPGEKHNFVFNTEGQMVRANFMGPGTHVYERVVRGDIPVSLSDRIAEEHDLRYATAKTTKDINVADEIMIAELNSLKSVKGDWISNIKQGELLKIKQKIDNAKSKLTGKNSVTFWSGGDNYSDEQRKTMQNKLQDLMTENERYNPYERKDRSTGGVMDDYYKNKASDDGTYASGLESWDGFLDYLKKHLDPKDPMTYVKGAGILYGMYKAKHIGKYLFKRFTGMDYDQKKQYIQQKHTELKNWLKNPNKFADFKRDAPKWFKDFMQDTIKKKLGTPIEIYKEFKANREMVAKFKARFPGSDYVDSIIKEAKKSGNIQKYLDDILPGEEKASGIRAEAFKEMQEKNPEGLKNYIQNEVESRIGLGLSEDQENFAKDIFGKEFEEKMGIKTPNEEGVESKYDSWQRTESKYGSSQVEPTLEDAPGEPVIEPTFEDDPVNTTFNDTVNDARSKFMEGATDRSKYMQNLRDHINEIKATGSAPDEYTNRATALLEEMEAAQSGWMSAASEAAGGPLGAAMIGIQVGEIIANAVKKKEQQDKENQQKYVSTVNMTKLLQKYHQEYDKQKIVEHSKQLRQIYGSQMDDFLQYNDLLTTGQKKGSASMWLYNKYGPAGASVIGNSIHLRSLLEEKLKHDKNMTDKEKDEILRQFNVRSTTMLRNLSDNFSLTDDMQDTKRKDNDSWAIYQKHERVAHLRKQYGAANQLPFQIQHHAGVLKNDFKSYWNMPEHQLEKFDNMNWDALYDPFRDSVIGDFTGRYGSSGFFTDKNTRNRYFDGLASSYNDMTSLFNNKKNTIFSGDTNTKMTTSWFKPSIANGHDPVESGIASDNHKGSQKKPGSKLPVTGHQWWNPAFDYAAGHMGQINTKANTPLQTGKNTPKTIIDKHKFTPPSDKNMPVHDPKIPNYHLPTANAFKPVENEQTDNSAEESVPRAQLNDYMFLYANDITPTSQETLVQQAKATFLKSKYYNDAQS